MAEHQLLQHQNIGDSFSGVYYVETAFVKSTQHGKEYQDLTIRDRSGRRYAKYWGVAPGISGGVWASLVGTVEEYMDKPSTILKKIELADQPDDLSPYISVYDDSEDLAERFDKIRDLLATLEAKAGGNTAGLMVDEVYGNSRFFEKFVVSPSGIGPHYGRQGGLLANTVRVAEACSQLMESYGMTDGEKVVLLASSLLFRIGAIDSFEFRDCVPVETKRGVLIGVNNLTMTRVSAALKRVASSLSKQGKAVSQDVIFRVLHTVTAYGGGVTPATKEALLLNSVCETDMEMVEAMDFIDSDPNEGEDFTAFDPKMKRRYYTG